MRRLTASLLLGAMSLALVLSTGCTSTTEIEDIKANASYWEGREVTIKGEVGNSFWIALLTKGAYEINDGTDSIWVVCSQSPPEKNAEVTVRGTVESAISIGDRSLGTVVVEKSRN